MLNNKEKNQEKNDSNEWDEIATIFKNAIDRKGLSKEEVLEIINSCYAK